jgi:AcrR family transcriptional regulator
MLRSGLRLVRAKGLRALTVRAVAADAGVNLGTFVYHFGSREAFADELIERWYAPLWAQLQNTVDVQAVPLERFRQLVLRLCEWIAGNRAFVGHLLLDAAAREAAALRFLRSLAARHPALILQAIGEAQHAGQLVRADPLHLMMFTMTATGVPILLAEGLGARRLVPAEMGRTMLSLALSPAHIEQRLAWVMAGIGSAHQ